MSIDLLIVVTTEKAGPYLTPMLAAANRTDSKVAVFFTNDGVNLVTGCESLKMMAEKDRAIVCAESWQHYLQDRPCPISLGSQTNHSQMIADATRVISL